MSRATCGRWVLAGCLLTLAGCAGDPVGEGGGAAPPVVEATERGRLEVPLPVRSPGALDELVGPLVGLGVVPAPEGAVTDVHAVFGEFVAGFEQEAHLVVLDATGEQARAGVTVIRLVDDTALVQEFRAYWVAALIDRFGALDVDRVGGEPVLVASGPGGAVLAWQPDVRTFLTIVGPDATETLAVGEQVVRAP